MRLFRQTAICLMSAALILAFVACNLKKEIKEKYKTEETVSYDNYQDALRANDFEAAHQQLEKLQGKEGYERAYDEVFNAEALYLCAIGDKPSFDRIVFLLSSVPIEGTPIPEGTTFKSKYDVSSQADEHARYIRSVSRYNQKCNTLIDLAIANHNRSLADRVLPLYKAVPMSVDNVSDSMQTMKYLWTEKEKAETKIEQTK